MKRNFSLFVALVLVLGMLGGCVVYPPGSSSRARRQIDKLEESLEESLGKLDERLEDLGDIPEIEDRLRKVEVYDAASGKLLGTLEDRADVRDFEDALSDQVNKHVNSLKELKETFAEPKGASPEYRFEAYAASVGKIDKGTLYKVLTITTYQDSPVVTLEVGRDLVKNLQSLLTFNIELRQSKVDALRGLAEKLK